MILEHQQEAITATIDRLKQSDPRTVLWMGTGTGKTFTASAILAEWTEYIKRQETGAALIVLWLTDRKNLAIQGRSEINAHQPQVSTSLEMGRHKTAWNEPQLSIDLGVRVIVGTVQSVAHRLERLPRPCLIIVDECHQDCSSPDHDSIYEHYKGVPRVGLTATPFDEKGEDMLIYGKWADYCYQLPLPEAINRGILCPIIAKPVPLEGVDLRNIDYSKENLSKKDTEKAEKQLLLEKNLWRMMLAIFEMPAPGIVFCPSTTISKALAEVMNKERPGSTRHIDCYMKEHHDGSALKDFKAGAFEWATNYRLWGYGVDLPNCRTVVFCCDQNRRNFEQGLGRAARWCCKQALMSLGQTCDCANKKREAWALDFYGNTESHVLWSIMAPKATAEQRALMGQRQREQPNRSAADIAAEVLASPLIAKAELQELRSSEIEIANPLAELTDRSRMVGFSLPKAGLSDKRADPRQIERIQEAFFYGYEKRLRQGRWVEALTYKQAYELLRHLDRRHANGKADPKILVQLARIRANNRPAYDRAVLQTMSANSAARQWENHRHWLKEKP